MTTPISFVSLHEAPEATWRKPASFAFVNDISQIPLADSELLLTSHYLPIAVDYVNDHPRVVAITDPRFQRTKVVGNDGKWQKGYIPLALRCLPFRISANAANEDAIEIAIDLPHGQEPGTPLFATDKSLASEVLQVVSLLRRLEDGKLQLQKAAERLLIAGVLTPLQLDRTASDAGAPSRSFTVNSNEFAALSSSRIAMIARDGFLPIDLAVACIYSQRLMTPLVSVTTRDGNRQNVAAAAMLNADDTPQHLRPNVQVDDGELFSFEQFEKVSQAK